MRRFLAVMTATALIAALTTAPAAAEPTASEILPSYVALGDGYAAGNGTRTGTGDCDRSPDAYPALYSAIRPALQFHHDACAAASTGSVSGTQLAHLDPATTLVTVTVGANDAGWPGLIADCLLWDVDRCAATAATADAHVSTVLPDNLGAMLRAIRTAAPHARLFVVGYPRLWDEPNRCPFFLTPAVNQQRMNAFTSHLNKILAVAAVEAQAESINPEQAFGGHGICSADPWITPLSPLDREGFHPNKKGHRLGYLPLLNAATGITVNPSTAGP